MRLSENQYKESFKNLSIADYLTLTRLYLSPFSLVFVFLQEEKWFAAFILFLFLTDILDGFLARITKTISLRGAKWDSRADFLTILFTITGSVFFRFNFFKDHIYAIFSTIFFYFITVIFSWIRYGKLSSFHTYLSKLAGLLLVFLFCNLFFLEWKGVVFYFILSVVWISLLEEFILICLLPYWKSDVKGLFWVLYSHSKIIAKRKIYFKNCFKYR